MYSINLRKLIIQNVFLKKIYKTASTSKAEDSFNV